MNKWLARLTDEFPNTPHEVTDKTHETGVLSVLGVIPHRGFEESRAANDAPGNARTCADCQHLTRRKTCGETEAAGLDPPGRFSIWWPPEGYAADCKGFTAKLTMLAQDRAYKLTPDQGDGCHAPCWDDAEIAAFTARIGRFALLGRADADNLAERLVIRDRDGDDRAMCCECSHYGPGRCGNHRRAGLHTPELGRDLATTLQRCPGFTS